LQELTFWLISGKVFESFGFSVVDTFMAIAMVTG